MTAPVLPPSRRRFVQGLAFAGGAASVGAPILARAQGAVGSGASLTGDRFDLTIGELPVNITGRRRMATAVNGSMPGPVLRFREGDAVTINVNNRLREATSIHWHGLRLPADMDGVPGLSFRGIMPGETFTYRFPIRQSGTYWYHSHSGMQEQTGLIGALILEPRDPAPHGWDRDYVVLLSDWTDEDPMTVVSNMKQQGDYYNFHQRTAGTFVADVKRKGLAATWADWTMWGRMRMSPTDIMDVTGATYTFLVNGLPPAANWTGLFKPGERVRLRFINGSSMSTFDVRLPGLGLTVVAADGSDVDPVTVEEFRIGVAETFDVIVQPDDRAYTIFAQAEDRTGYARGTLTPRAGLTAAVPSMDPRPMRSMTDMGMEMGAMGGMKGMDMSSQDMAAMRGMKTAPLVASAVPVPAGGGMSGMNMSAAEMAAMPGMSPAAPSPRPAPPPTSGAMSGMAGMDMSAKDMAAMPGMDMSAKSPPATASGATTATAMTAPGRVNADGVDPRTLQGQPNVDNVAMATHDRQGQPGDGLGASDRRVLVYSDLKAIHPDAETRPVDRDIEFHLTGNMQRWTWGFDGKKFSDALPIHVKLGERVRFVLINDTMMEHPIHLHGFLFSLENGQTGRLPLKHTVNVKPAERVSFVFTADTPGHWAFHCHLLYHMESGMFRTVVVA